MAGTDVSLVLFLSEKNAFKTLENIICSTVTCVPSHEQRTLSDWAMVKTLKGVGGF